MGSKAFRGSKQIEANVPIPAAQSYQSEFSPPFFIFKVHN